MSIFSPWRRARSSRAVLDRVGGEGGNQPKAAELHGIIENTLQNRMWIGGMIIDVRDRVDRRTRILMSMRQDRWPEVPNTKPMSRCPTVTVGLLVTRRWPLP